MCNLGRITYIAMSSEMLQELDFSQRPLRQNLFTEDIGDLLDRNALACGDVRGSTA